MLSTRCIIKTIKKGEMNMKVKTIDEALKTMNEDEFVAHELKLQEEVSKNANPILADLFNESEDEIREYYQSHKHSLGG